MSYCYAVASGKGGVGKSTVTANLAAALAQAGNRVVIVDADIGLRSQDALLGMENRIVYDLIDLANGGCDLDQAVLSSEDYPTLYLLPASQFARAKALDPKKFTKIIRTLRASYDYVFIDCPAGIERGLRNVLNAGVDEVLLIVTPDDISVRSAERAVQIMEAKEINRPSLIVNRLDADLVRSHEMMSARTVSEVMDLRLLGEIPEDPVVGRAMLRHSLFIHYDCEARNAILRVASRLCGGSPAFPAYGCKKQSFLQRLFSGSIKEVIPLDDH
ncbi:MAG: septum site-determining protein MinD [Clostridia bacterium]|nr:septum site-determining protein MinD [Clostridia bacterium]